MSEPTRLRDLTAHQWKSGIAAWLGWLFDGLDMHLYTVVAVPFVAQLLSVSPQDDSVKYYSSVIQASFLLGWALGGGFFGRLGDRLGRSRALMLTILTYASFTGLSFVAQNWWQLLICRFLAALGIGGEWAVGAALLSETWPKRWRPWIAATLQTAVNVGILFAMGAVTLLSMIPYGDPYYQYRTVFLVGILPALLVFWIRKAVPEPEEWHAAREAAGQQEPRLRDLFRGSVLRLTLLSLAVCALSLTAHWAFMFWSFQHLGGLLLQAGVDANEITRYKTSAMVLLMIASVMGNYMSGAIARAVGYRWAIAGLFVAYYLAMLYTYSVPREASVVYWCFAPLGAVAGVFGLFTMYLPPLFPTLLRTTGAGFCYNIGRVVAAAGTVAFGLLPLYLGAEAAKSIDMRLTLLYSSFLFLPAAAIALLLPEPPDEA
jgi:MFS family permease